MQSNTPEKYYQLTNQPKAFGIGNLLTTVSDRKLEVEDGNGGIAYYTADIISSSDYYPFGFQMDGRDYSSDEYRYGFNGMEKDNEFTNSTSHYDFGARIYDSRIGRWLAVDPKARRYPDFSPYNYVLNSPLVFKDPNGEFPFLVIPIMIGLLTAPSLAVAPSLDPVSDAAAIEKARQLKNKWLLFSVLSGAGGSMNGYKQIATELGRQFSIQFLGNFSAQLLEGKDFDPGKAVHDALINIDIGDAIISSMNFDDFTTIVGTSMIDITATEAKALGLGKEAKKVEIDFIFNAIASKTDKLPKGKYADLAKRIQKVVEDKAKKFVVESLEESTNTDVQNFLDESINSIEYNTIHEPDALDVNNTPLINNDIPESITEESNSGG